MEKAKMVLEYLKVFIWPLLVLLIIIVFHGSIKENLYRLSKAELFGVAFEIGGSSIDNDKTNSNSVPATAFSYQQIYISEQQCLEIGIKSLTKSGFENPDKGFGSTNLGYKGDYVGAIWCIVPQQLAVMLVAGPSYEEANAKRNELQSSFLSELQKKK